VRHLLQDARRAIKQGFIHIRSGDADEQLGGFFRAISQGRLGGRLPGRGLSPPARGELHGVARQLQGLGVDALVHEVHGDEMLDAAPEPAGVIQQARTMRPLVVHDGQGLLHVLP